MSTDRLVFSALQKKKKKSVPKDVKCQSYSDKELLTEKSVSFTTDNSYESVSVSCKI